MDREGNGKSVGNSIVSTASFHMGRSHFEKRCIQGTNVWCLRLARLKLKKLNSVALVRERTIPTERPPPVGEVSANFCG